MKQSTEKVKTISILGTGWLTLPLAIKLQKKNYILKGSTTTISKLNQLEQLGIIAYHINIIKNNIHANIQSDFLNTDLLILSIPPKVKTYGEDFHIWQIQEIINQISSLPKHFTFNAYIIYLSSTSVYGDNQGYVDEETIPLPTKASGKTILQAEKLLQEKFNDRLTIIRLGGLIGPERKPSMLSKKNPQILQSNLPINLIHLEDACEIIISIIEKKAWGEIFNAVADEHPTKKEFYTKISSISKEQKQKTEINNGKIVSNDKIKKILHLQSVPLKLFEF